MEIHPYHFMKIDPPSACDQLQKNSLGGSVSILGESGAGQTET